MDARDLTTNQQAAQTAALAAFDRMIAQQKESFERVERALNNVADALYAVARAVRETPRGG